MAKLVSAQTEQQILDTIATVSNMAQPTTSRRRSRVKGSGGGAQRPYITITSATDVNNYVGNVITSPTDSTVIVSGVDIVANQPNAGEELPTGYESFSDKIGDVYYIEPSVFIGS